jgi:uncharacterized membrane protein YesL
MPLDFVTLITFDDEPKLWRCVIIKLSNFLCTLTVYLFPDLCIVYITSLVAQTVNRRMISFFHLKRTQAQIFMIVQNVIIKWITSVMVPLHKPSCPPYCCCLWQGVKKRGVSIDVTLYEVSWKSVLIGHTHRHNIHTDTHTHTHCITFCEN